MAPGFVERVMRQIVIGCVMKFGGWQVVESQHHDPTSAALEIITTILQLTKGNVEQDE